MKSNENTKNAENTSFKGKVTKSISERIIGIKCWECILPTLGEPKMPIELFMEDCED